MEIQARIDASLPMSIISVPVRDRLKQRPRRLALDPVKDSENNIYQPVDQCRLQWRIKNDARGYCEAFYVIESDVEVVILREKALLDQVKPGERSILPIGLSEQTPGMLTIC